MTARALGEYADGASARRREGIIREQKFPATYMTAYYRDAFNLIRSALRSGEDTVQKLRDGAALLAMKPTPNKRDGESKTACLDAVATFARLYPDLPLKGWTVTPAKDFEVVIEKVPVSVFPVAILTRRVGQRIVTGALFLVFRKGPTLRENGGTIMAELLRQALTRDGRSEVFGQMCLVVDVFRGQQFTAPRTNSKLNAELRSVCREIVDRWPIVAA
jgi:hypothetical protein